jgi:hypothetical protein
MGEKGVFTFRQYCELGASKWIEATSQNHGTAIIYVGRPRRSPLVDGLRLRPHSIRPVSEKKRRTENRRAGFDYVQKTLFELNLA